MKLVSPCCKNIQEYKPRKPFDWSKRHKTACKKCSINFDVSKDLVVVGESEEKKGEKETITLAKGKPSNVVNTDLIDDPNELLMSCAMRELNKSNPEVRWANILLQLLDKTKQLEAKSKSDVQSQLKQYSTSELIELRKKLIES